MKTTEKYWRILKITLWNLLSPSKISNAAIYDVKKGWKKSDSIFTYSLFRVFTFILKSPETLHILDAIDLTFLLAKTIVHHYIVQIPINLYFIFLCEKFMFCFCRYNINNGCVFSIVQIWKIVKKREQKKHGQKKSITDISIQLKILSLKWLIQSHFEAKITRKIWK